MESIPEELVEVILLNLDGPSLARAVTVNSLWHRIISAQQFWYHL